MLAISTAWNVKRHSSVKELLLEVKSLGFDAIEIGYRFSRQHLKDLLQLKEEVGIEVASVHNFCPAPTGVKPGRFITDYYRISSLDEVERRKAVDYTKRTIDTANIFSSRVVVIHAGTVELEKDYVEKLLCLYKEKKQESKRYLSLKAEILALREKEKIPYFESVVRSLQEILPYAYSSGVKIGLETRYYPNEIPNIDEISNLLTMFSGQGLVYWHDLGHGEVNEKLGINAHNEYFIKFAQYMFGMHIHDLVGINDHMAPFSGEFDFSKITPYIHGNLLKVIEVHPPATYQQIKESVKNFK